MADRESQGWIRGVRSAMSRAMPKVTNLDTNALRSFVRGFELDSFTRAAAAVGRSQSALSSQLRKLEVQVGEPLVRRSGRKLSLTPAGEALLRYATQILKLNDEALHTIGASHVAQTVSLGIPPDFAESWLTGVLGAYAQSHPDVQVVVQADRSNKIMERVETGQLDLAITWGGVLPAAEAGPRGRQSY